MEKQLLKQIIYTIRTAWEQFWFRTVSTSTLAVFRILFGVLLIQYALLLMPDLYVWFGRNGIVSSTTVNAWQQYVRLNILNLFPHSDLWLSIVFATFVVSAIALTIGLMTRLSCILVFICLSSLHARNYLIINSGDIFMQMLCFWLIFSPAGQSLSIDQWRSSSGAKRGEEPCEAERGKARLDEQSEEQAALITDQWRSSSGAKLGALTKETTKAEPWAQRLMQINMSLLYGQAFIAKIIGSDWQSGTAIYFSSRLVEMHRFPLHYLFDHLWTCRLLSWAVLGIEFSLCTLIWIRPLRYYVLIMGLIMHLTMDWTMNIPQFQWIMIVSYILFVDPEDMDIFLCRVRRFFAMLLSKLHFSQTLI